MKTFLTFLMAAAVAAAMILPADPAPTKDPHPATVLDAAQWTAVSTTTTATIYHAVPSQCNSDVRHTASMFVLDLDDVASQRVAAMERTMMKRHGIRYGDIILVTGAGDLDGLWQVQDTMNKRFAGKDKIDLLVPTSRKTGFWKDVTVSVPANKPSRTLARKAFEEM